MPIYQYKAADSSGEIVTGEMVADSDEQVVTSLQAAGQIPIRITTKKSAWSFAGKSIRARDIEVFTQELSTLLSAGLTLDRSLQIVSNLADDSRMRSLTERLLNKIRGGSTLSQAMEAEPAAFSKFFVSMIRAGELGGALEGVLSRLSDYLTRAKELRDTVVSALIYPMILLVVSVASVLLLMIFVVPHFTQLFDDAGRTLPLLTQAVIGTADFLQSYWWLIPLAVIGLVSAAKGRLKQPAIREKWDRRLLGWPIVGDLVRKIETARMCRTLGTLLGNGVPVLPAMSIVKETLGNRAMESGLSDAISGLKEGQGMSRRLMETELFPSLSTQMIQVGEETGQLEEMLLKVADIYDREVKQAVERALSLLEPLLIVSLGLIIATIIMSILVAIVSVNELAF